MWYFKGINVRKLVVFAFLARINFREFMIEMNFVSLFLILRDKFETECSLEKVIKGSFSRPPRPTALWFWFIL